MLDPLSHFSFKPVLHKLRNNGCGMCHPVREMLHTEDPLLLIGKCGSRFPLSLSEW